MTLTALFKSTIYNPHAKEGGEKRKIIQFLSLHAFSNNHKILKLNA